VKIYSNKEFSQLPKFLRNEQVVPDSFRKLYESFGKLRDWSNALNGTRASKEKEAQLTILETYTRKGQESCNYSYRLSKAEQLRSGLHQPVIVVCLLNPVHNQT
jgi:hypothetical protein